MFQSIKDIDNPYYITLETALDRIKEGTSQPKVSQVREGKTNVKKELPVALFSGVFSGRRDSDIKGHSGYIILDFDHINIDRDWETLGWLVPSLILSSAVSNVM